MKTFYFAFLIAVMVYCDLSAQEINHGQIVARETKVEQVLTPKYLYKIISSEQWQDSLLKKAIILSSMDQDFIHLATDDQLPNVIKKFWSGKDYVVLKLISKKLKGRLVYETNPGGMTKYYHLYDGNIPFEAIETVSDKFK